MNRKLILLPIAAALAVSACNSSDHNLVDNGPPDPMANELKNAPPVELPPAITASKVYRCKDNSLVYIDWLSNGAARVKKNKTDATGTDIPAGSADIKGDAKAPTITYKGQSCKG
ncbi:hypothetical protein M8312_07440 [Sphingomonas sp. KRR8]|uniref:hypothetical protein n=1 Tax=Sphingomonas sp. KRR8 TaxID=2942996 RepID=UPI0020215450|nr:hypothetical protein [Sphingomonas sp. KRR8]URD59661.1 hypothetical protein M8312_07440 [Sphingomonas sp. KRR8]